MKNSALLFGLLLSLILPAHGQVKAISVNGDSVLLYDNFTWKPIIKEAPKPKEPTPIVLVGTVAATVDASSASGKSVISSEEWSSFGVDNDKVPLSGSMKKDGDNYVAIISFSGDIGCLSKELSYLRIKLSNGMMVECKQTSETSCGDSRSAEFLIISEEQLASADPEKAMENNTHALMTSDWESIRVYGSSFFADLKPSKSKSSKEPEQFFRQHLSAIMRVE